MGIADTFKQNERANKNVIKIPGINVFEIPKPLLKVRSLILFLLLSLFVQSFRPFIITQC